MRSHRETPPSNPVPLQAGFIAQIGGSGIKDSPSERSHCQPSPPTPLPGRGELEFWGTYSIDLGALDPAGAEADGGGVDGAIS